MSSTAAPGVSFGFAKTKTKQSTLLQAAPAASGSFARGDAAAEDDPAEKEYLKDASEVKERKKEKVKEDLVIPCRGNRVQLNKVKAEKEKSKKDVSTSEVKEEVKEEPKDGDDLNALAAKEILADAERWQEEKDAEAEERDGRMDMEIPMAAAEGDKEEEEERRQKESTLDDYDAVPVQGFGMGMLRGMGYKPGEGIGGFKKLDVKCLDPVLRPKGLGLGAARPGAKGDGDSKKKDKDGDEELVLKKGAYVKVLSGPNREMYGQVDGMDEDAARVFVKLAVGGKNASVSENAVRLVTTKEYKKYSKVINRDLYDEYEEKQRSRQDEWDRGRDGRDRDVVEDESGGRRKAKKRSRSRSPRANGSSSKKSKKSSRRNSDDESPDRRKRSWLRPHLRVRFIDDRYKKGRYYKSKMVVDDVQSADRCSCRADDDGAYLDDVRPRQLETVVPRAEGAAVMVVRGEMAGAVGEMLRRDRDRGVAAVRVLPDGDIVKMDFDDICEYTGEIPEY